MTIRRIIFIAFIIAATPDGVVAPSNHAEQSRLRRDSFRLARVGQDEVRYYKSYYATPRDRPDMDIISQRDLHEEAPQFYNERVRWEGRGEDRTLTIYREEICFNKNVIKSEFVLSADDNLTLSNSRRKWIAPDGVVIRDREIVYDHPSLEYPDRTFHMMMVPWVIRAMEMKPKNEVKIFVWVDATVVLPLIITVEGEERIKTAAGEFDCWKISARLDRKEIDDITGAIFARTLTKFLFWMEKGGTHGLVRLRFPITAGIPGRQDRYITQDLVQVKNRHPGSEP